MLEGHWKFASEKTELIYLYLTTFYFRFRNWASRTQLLAVACFNVFKNHFG